MKWPFLKFYVRDWQSDFELRMCSLEARGYWFECLCIMHSARRRGYMETPQGVALTDDQTSRLMGTSKGDLLRCVNELTLHGVPSFEDGTGIMYCRRMVKDTQKAEKCSVAGKRYGGNPLLKTNSLIQIPEARSHISLEVTFKGQISDHHAEMIEDVLNCVPEFNQLNPESIIQVIHDAGANSRIKENHDEFIKDMANWTKLPNIPVKKYGRYWKSSGLHCKKNDDGRRKVSL